MVWTIKSRSWGNLMVRELSKQLHHQRIIILLSSDTRIPTLVPSNSQALKTLPFLFPPAFTYSSTPRKGETCSFTFLLCTPHHTPTPTHTREYVYERERVSVPFEFLLSFDSSHPTLQCFLTPQCLVSPWHHPIWVSLVFV